MLNIKTLLDIKYYNGSTYSSLKMKMGAAGRDTAVVTLSNLDYLYIGYEKPIKNIYFDFATPNVNANSLTVEYSNGTDWTELEVFDETEGFTRSVIIQWEEVASDLTDEFEVDSDTLYWYRISASAIHSEATWNFIGLLLSTDDDLVLENPYILETNLLMGETNHLKAHISARNEIVQSCANRGNKKTNNEPITYWDMLNISEFKQGAIFLTLSKIYLNLSDKDEDVWLKKSYTYRNRYQKQLDLYYVTLDKDNDGVTSASEKSAKSVVKTMTR